MLVSTGYASTTAMSIWVAFTTAWGHGDTQVQDAAKGCVWNYGPTASKVCVEVHDLCYYQRPGKCQGSGPQTVVFLESGAIPQSGHYRSKWPVLWFGTMVSSRPGLLSRAVSG